MRAVLRRLAHGLVVVTLVACATFLCVKGAPGDPFGAALDHPSVSESQRAQWRASWGLDAPAPVQLWRWVSGAARGDFGYAFSRSEPVASAIGHALPYSLLLMAVALAASVAIGVAMGIAQARRAHSTLDRISSATTFFVSAAPEAWIALIFLASFAVWWPVLPVGGSSDPLAQPSAWLSTAVDFARHLALPFATLTLIGSAVIARQQRAAAFAVLPEEFVRAARARGVPETRIWNRHILRAAFGPVCTIVGLSLPALAGGAVFVERVFAWPGMGMLVAQGVASRDAPLVAACVVLTSALVVAGSIIADGLAAWANPRIGTPNA